MSDARLTRTALGPYRVLDLTDESGQLCGKILGDLGADVIKIEPPGGDPSRRLGPFYKDQVHPEKSLWWFSQNTSKRSVTLDLETKDGQAVFKKLVETAHFVIESFPPGYMASLGLDYEALAKINPGIIVTSITPFGQTGPRAHYKGGDIVNFAMGGLMFLCGDPDRPPVRIGPPQSSCMVSAHAAVGTLIAHHFRQRTGEGQHVDQSVQESFTWAMDYSMMTWDLNRVISRRVGGARPVGQKVVRVVYPCMDGYILCIGLLGPSYDALVEWMNSSGEGGDLDGEQWKGRSIFPGPGELSAEELDHVQGIVAAFIAKREKRYLYEEAQRRRVIFMPASTPKDLLENPQLEARMFFERLEHPELDDSLTYTGAVAKMSETPYKLWCRAPLIGEHNEEVLGQELGLSRAEIASLSCQGVVGVGPKREHHRVAIRKEHSSLDKPDRSAMEGLKVLEFAWVGVGPMVGKYLAEHGASVIRVESMLRPETLRTAPPYKDNVVDVNMSGYFANWNDSKLGISLNLNHPRAIEIAKRLIDWADVVTESFTPRAMRKWGLDYDSLRETRPDLVMISMPMLGQTGPYAHHLGYGNVLQGLAGVTNVTGWPDRPPVGTGVAYTDFFVTHFCSTMVLAALEYRNRTGKGQYIDFSQFEAAIQALGPAILDYSVNGREYQRAGNDLIAGGLPYAAPHGVYKCKGEERWCAIAVYNDAEWDDFCQVLGDPSWTKDPRFATMLGRAKHLREIDRQVEAWTIQRSPEEVMELLQAADVPAGVVQNAEDMRKDPQLEHRGHYVTLEHAMMGPCAYDLPSFRLSKTPCRLTMAAPLLGQHNEQVYKEILGISEDEYVELLIDGALE